VKLRINRALHDRARACADLIGVPLSEFARLSLKKYMKGDLNHVAVASNLLNATSKTSTVITLDGIAGPPDVVRCVIASAVIFAESRRPKPFQTDLLEGVDYIVGASEC
jgi:hypothetical protein